MSLIEISPKFTTQVLQQIVRMKLGPEAEFVAWRFSGGFNKGDSYLSEVFKVEIDAKTTEGLEKIRTVIKSVPKNVGRRKTFRSGDFFRNEINFYNIILRQALDFQKLKSPQVPFIEVATCLASYFDGENDYIVLEDLTQEGFGTVSRQTGMDFNHIKLALETLGRFHGLSLVYRHHRAEEFERALEFVEETYYAARLKSWYKEFQKSQEMVARHAVQTELPGSRYLQKLEELFKGDLYDKMVEWTHSRNRYSVLSHGDCWTPNFLFKYDPGNPTVPRACKMIDFQLARFASPALDISFFVYSCTDQALRERHYDELLRAYHRSLSDLVRSFGSDPEVIFPWNALLEEMQQKARFGVGMGIESIPFSVMEEGCDLDQIQGDKEVPITSVWVLKPIEDKEGRLRLAEMFKHATDCGYLD